LEIKNSNFLIKKKFLSNLPLDESFGMFIFGANYFNKIIKVLYSKKEMNFEKIAEFFFEAHMFLNSILRVNFKKNKHLIPTILNVLFKYISHSSIFLQQTNDDNFLNLKDQVLKFQNMTFKILIKVLNLIQMNYIQNEQFERETNVLNIYLTYSFENEKKLNIPFYEKLLNLWKIYLFNDKSNLETFKYDIYSINNNNNQNNIDEDNKNINKRRKTINEKKDETETIIDLFSNLNDNISLEFSKISW
jgi:hypothetical protein